MESLDALALRFDSQIYAGWDLIWKILLILFAEDNSSPRMRGIFLLLLAYIPINNQNQISKTLSNQQKHYPIIIRIISIILFKFLYL